MDTKDKDLEDFFDRLSHNRRKVRVLTEEEQEEAHREIAAMWRPTTKEDFEQVYICSDYVFGNDSNKLYEENERIINKILNRKSKE